MGKTASSLERAIRILELLKEHTWTPASTLAKDLQVSERTVFRYMKQIDLAFGGYPVFESSMSGYRLARKVLEDIWQGKDDASTAAAILTSPYSGKLKVPSNRLDRFLSALQSRIRVENDVPESLLHSILKSFIDRRICSIEYKVKSRTLSLSVLPLRLVSEHGIYYLQVQDLVSKTIKLLAIDKMNIITVGQKETDPRETQRLLEFIDSAWGIMVTGEIQKVTFKVDEDICPYFENHKIHWTQQNEKADSTLQVSIAIHNIEEFKRWIYRFGNHISDI
ncbi:MAG: WYL domain-containing transcriptional regulator [Rectinemataceae bacterium]|nr:WYL domain-containing transcriptional regulator [Rectinemataceae bacterium]